MGAEEKNISFKPSSKKERFGILMAGFLGNKVMADLFNKVLYPWVIWKNGAVCGGLIMVFASIIVCLLTLEFYDWAKKDWLGIETLKEAKDAEHGSRILRWAMKKSDWVLFVALSMLTDPFVTVIALRKGSWQFNGLSKRDWKIFFGSLVIGDLWWISILSGGIVLIRTFVLPWFGH